MNITGIVKAYMGATNTCKACGETKKGAYKDICQTCYQRRRD